MDALVAKTHAPVTPRPPRLAAATASRRDHPCLPLILVVDVLSRATQPVHAERATIVEQHRPAERPKHLVLPAHDDAGKVDVVRAVDQRLKGQVSLPSLSVTCQGERYA